MGRMERDVVYCPQNVMFVLPRKMLKILSVVHLEYVSQKFMPVYVDAIKILGACTYTIFTFLQCTIVSIY